MIGFFQNTMAKHHRLMFGLLLVIIVVSFVFYTGSGSAMDLLGFRKSPEVCGVKLNDREAEPYRKAVLLTYGNQLSDSQYRSALVQRIVMEHLADTYQIPNPSQAAFDAFTKQFFGLKDGDVLDPARFGMEPEELKRLLIQTWRIAELQNLFAGSPATFDEEVALHWRELNTSWTIETARINLEKIQVSPKADDAALEAYFSQNAERYRIAPLVKLAYAIAKPTAEMRAKIPEPKDSELKMFMGMQDKTLSSDQVLNAELAKNRATWVKRWKQDRLSLSVASSTSDMLAEKLAQDLVNPEAPEFADAVKNSGLNFTNLTPFPSNEIPAKASVPAEILRDVVPSLNSTLWRTDAIPFGENALVVIFLGNEPSRIPALSEVKQRVAADWQASEIANARHARVKELGDTLRKEVAAGKSFDAAAKALGMTPKKEKSFTMQTLPENLQAIGSPLFDALKSLPEKTVSDRLYSGNEAVFVYRTAKSVPAVDMKSENFRRLAELVNGQVSQSTLRVQLSNRIGEELLKVIPQEEAQ